jgi:DNA-binding transcriptional MerR regulator
MIGPAMLTDHLSRRTRDLALAGGISVQQVRNYEASGLIPQAPRSPSGYRLYALHPVREQHSRYQVIRKNIPHYEIRCYQRLWYYRMVYLQLEGSA